MTPRTFTRTDTSVVGRWWWTVDRWLLAAILLLSIIGIILLMAAGPAAATRIRASDPFHFVRRQLEFLPLALLAMTAISIMTPLWIRRFGTIVFVSSLLLLLMTPFFGAEIKGATRWIYIGGTSIQPSEFIKPSFAIVSAWMFSAGRAHEQFPGFQIAMILFALVAFLLIIQPDFGQTMVVTIMWCAQFFLAGLPLLWVILFAGLGMAGAIGAYTIFPHVQSRVNRFLNPEVGDTYQVEKALQAFRDGGLFGRGPGEGMVKQLLPDSHTDFIFAVAGEEFGIFLCLLIVGLFGFILLRATQKMTREDNLFILIAIGGLAVQLGLQAFINIASSLHMIPTKGMTLPFISYGGSSTLGLALTAGMLLALTRRRPSSVTGDIE